ncbi:DUF4817 domain-containing protein [Trichonephila clavipes]|nr:DUF4817 domain-containing protein [Trichonephila clavipes]
MQISPSRVELAARGQNDKKESAGRKLYFHRTQTGCTMAEYTNAEKVDMILAYGATDCNGRAAQRLILSGGLLLIPCLLAYTSNYVKPVHSEGSTSVWRILDDSALHPFHYQRAQSLKECDFAPRQAFSQWYLQQRIANPFFAASVLFTDEASFSREGIFNTHNSHSWAAANPHVTRTRAAQDRFLVNVWAGILRYHLIGPYILPDRLTGPRYLIFLEQVLPELLDSAHVTAATRTSMWFQQDGAPAHFSISVRNHLDATCGER